MSHVSSSSITARSSPSSSRAGCARRACTPRSIRPRDRRSGFATGSRRASFSAAARTPSTRTARRRPIRRSSTSRRCSAICYGMQSSRTVEGGEVIAGGRARVRPRRARRSTSRRDCSTGFTPARTTPVWMSHGDHVDAPPPGYVVTASSGSVPIAAMRHATKPIHCVQFHPEVAHTPRGGEIIANFLFGICKAEPTWTPGAFVEQRGRRRFASSSATSA